MFRSDFFPSLLLSCVFLARLKFFFALNHKRNATLLTVAKNATQAILGIAPARTIILISKTKKKFHENLHCSFSRLGRDEDGEILL